MSFENEKLKINVSDFQKVSAVTAVILQTVLGFALAHTTDGATQSLLGALYILVKYTAPMFIFAIVYNMVKVSHKHHYWDFLKEKCLELVVPYILWTFVYLAVLPNVQQKVPYDSIGTFLLKCLVGDAGPHLWYTVMMLQIQLCMPLFIWLGYKVFTQKRFVWPVLGLATVLYVAWYVFYQQFIFTGSYHDSWYLLDRFVFSFLIYGIYGVAAFRYHEQLFKVLHVVRFLMVPAILLSGMVAIQNFLNYSDEISFGNTTYLNTTQSIYSLVVILSVFYLASVLIQHNSRVLPAVKFLSTYAYRSYLANVFVFQMLVKVFGPTWLKLPTGWMIIFAYFMTVMGSFIVAYGLHVIFEAIRPKKVVPQKYSKVI